MFTFEELCQLIRVVSETGVAGVEVERDGSRVRVDGVPPTPQAIAAATPLLSPQMFAAAQLPPAMGTMPTGPAPAAPAADSDEGLHFVTSPIVGTFYRAPNPEAEPYVKIGDLVHKGQVPRPSRTSRSATSSTRGRCCASSRR
ncbi:MAG: acetyl-CoA carboxylase [Acidobacteria bacterium]|nr:acetyl-CoA carboxylase [Acidobacteriota bacterium]